MSQEQNRIEKITIIHEGTEKTVSIIKNPVIEDIVMYEVRKLVYEKLTGAPQESSFNRSVKQELFQDIQGG